ncbi:MAG: hypothetical protein QXP88_00355 [Thermoproteota archaeon]
MKTNKTTYICFIEHNQEDGYDGYIEDLGIFVVGKKSKEEVKKSIRKGLEVHMRSLYGIGNLQNYFIHFIEKEV